MLNFLIIVFIRLISDSLRSCEELLLFFFSEITIVSSPFGSFLKGSKSSIFFLIYSSYNFEISLQKTTFLPLKKFFNSGIILLIFLVETKKTTDWSNFDNFFKSLIRACFLSDKNPLKKNFSEKPLIDTAVETAETPGIGITFILFLTHSLTKIDPGSEILGVPASEIKEIISPDFKRLIILSKFLVSLNL